MLKKSRIHSPARSVGPSVTPRRYKTTRATRRVGSPARSTTSERLSTFVEKFREDNMDSMNSILSDDTDIEIDQPRRKSWWKNLDDSYRDVMEVVNDNTVDEDENILDYYLHEDSPTQENTSLKKYMYLPESSDSDSSDSIVLPPRRLFNYTKSQPKKNFWPNVSRGAIPKQDKTRVEDNIHQVKAKKLFGRGQQKRKPIFPKDLIISPDKTLLNDELTSVGPKKLFSLEHSKKKRFPAFPSAGVYALEKEANEDSPTQENTSLKKYMYLPESSDSDSIASIELPPRRLFNYTKSQPKKNFWPNVSRGAIPKQDKTRVEDNIHQVKAKKLFGRGQQKRKPIFPKDLIISPDKTLLNDELTSVEPKKLFSREHSKKKRFPAFPSAGVHALEKEANETGTPLHKNAIGKPMFSVDEQENENEESDNQSAPNEEDNDVAVLDEQEYENEKSDDQYEKNEPNYESNDITDAEEQDNENQESDDQCAENEQENDMSVVDEQEKEKEEPDDQYIENAENYQDDDITVDEEKENDSNYEDHNMYVDEEKENEESDNRVKENENNDHRTWDSHRKQRKILRQKFGRDFFDKLKDDVIARKQRMKEKVAESLKEPRQNKLKPGLGARKVKPAPSKAKSKYVPSVELNKASWCTKRLYKFLETKLEPKYDYEARVRAEGLVERLFDLGETIKKHNVASQESIDELKREMARLNIVKTHFEFYDFFMEYMPREMRIKVVPDFANNLPLPKHGVYSDIQWENVDGCSQGL